jgi:hypothetical protein
MRFIAGGPSIPDELLVARDAGDVIFFCGAGVSQHEAKLPNFETLGRSVIDILGAAIESPARKLLDKALEMGRMAGVGGLLATDRVFGLLEREFEVGDVRAAVAEAIRPKPEYGLGAHQILIDLATSQAGVTRLVTTNFDLLFEECDSKLGSFGPPSLPDPRNDREFRGIVHLHGRVDAKYERPQDDEFVVSSRDFGRAYLLDGWATRFIRSLLERFQIVFVGYTADDPPVQYLLEALNLHAGSRARLFAFQAGDTSEAAALWEHRGVQAISFDSSNGFEPLWQTLAAWAERARNVDSWYAELIASAAPGPAKLSPYVRGQVAHVLSTREGATRVARSDTLLDGSWLLGLDPHQRYSDPVHIDLYNKTKGPFDPFTALGLDTDLKPKSADPNRWFERRTPPPDASDILKLTRTDFEEMSNPGGGELRGDVAAFASAMPPRLAGIGFWIQRVAHQPITFWWAAQQSGLHATVRSDIEWALRREPERFSATIRRGWRLLFAVWDDRRFDPDRLRHDLETRVRQEGWSQSLVRAVAGLYRPRLKVKKRFDRNHPLSGDGPVSEDLIYFDVDYPSPHIELRIPDDQLRYAVQQFRANLELAISLEAEVTGHSRLYFETSRADDGATMSKTRHGLTGPIVMMQDLMGRLATFDPPAARTEIARWPVDDEQVFARLRIWAASQTLLSARESADVFLGLSNSVFWGSGQERDLLYALRDRWADFNREDRAAIEHRLRTGSFPWKDDVGGGPSRMAAFDRMNRLHWLNRSGVEFSFDVAAEMDALRALAPEWTEGAGDSAADSHASEVYTVETDTDPQPLLETPIEEILVQAQEAGQMGFRDRVQREPFRGLAERRPIRALAALTHAMRRGQTPGWAWSTFLRADKRASDPLRLIQTIAGRLIRMPLPSLHEIAYPVSDWMEQIAPRLYGDAAGALPALWDRLIDALNHAEPERQHQADSGWADDALNAPVGSLYKFLSKDPAKKDRKAGEGFPAHWLMRLDQLLSLRGELRCQALVLISYKLNWLYAIDPAWTERQLLPSAASNLPDGDAFWDGVMWSAHVPNRTLFGRIVPALIERTRRPRAQRHDSTIMAGFLLAGWGSPEDATEPEGVVSNAQLREILIWSDDELRIQMLWQLKQWSGDAETRWRERVIPFFTDVWPKQRALRTPAISSRLADFLLASGNLMPTLMPIVLPRLVPIRGDTLLASLPHDNPEKDVVRRFPAAMLELLWTILGENPVDWPYQIEAVLDLLAAAPETSSDPRLSELRRRRDRGS